MEQEALNATHLIAIHNRGQTSDLGMFTQSTLIDSGDEDRIEGDGGGLRALSQLTT